jgi:transcriptional regulator with XRE-family HTH domain
MLSRNEIFKKVLDWLYAEHKVVDQREFSVRTGINEATISRIINNRVKQPSADTIRKIVDTFPEINPGYLRGEDENITILPSPTPTPQPTTDTSNMVPALLAAKDEIIESLKRELQTKDELIASLRRELRHYPRNIDDSPTLASEPELK